MIKIEELNKYYGKLHVLRDISLELHGGECVAFIGPNGCGKTTLMKCVLGLVNPCSGRIFVNGKDALTTPKSRESIGFMSQNSSFPPNMTVKDVFDTILTIRNYKGQLDKELFEAFAIKEIYGKKMNELSGGTSQKVNAVLAFLFNPEILILDEPTASLDPFATEILKKKILDEKKKDKLICITSHILSELEGLVSRLIFIEDGNIVLDNEVKQLLASTSANSLIQAVMTVLNDNKDVAHNNNK